MDSEKVDSNETNYIMFEQLEYTAAIFNLTISCFNKWCTV